MVWHKHVCESVFAFDGILEMRLCNYTIFLYKVYWPNVIFSDATYIPLGTYAKSVKCCISPWMDLCITLHKSSVGLMQYCNSIA